MGLIEFKTFQGVEDFVSLLISLEKYYNKVKTCKTTDIEEKLKKQ